MKKLKSLQLPHPPPPPTSEQQIESTSSSIDNHHRSSNENEKENIQVNIVAVDGMENERRSSENPDIFNVVLQQQQQQQEIFNENRPRQYGRRSNPMRISSFLNIPESLNHATAVSNFFSYIFSIF